MLTKPEASKGEDIPLEEIPDLPPIDDDNDAQQETQEGHGIDDLLTKQLDSLSDPQKEFILKYLPIPEIQGVLGLILGNEAVEYFSQYLDPTKTIQIVDRPQQAQPQAQASAQQQPSPSAPQQQQGMMAPAV